MARPKEGWKLRFPRREGDAITVRFTDAQGRSRELSTGTRDPGEAATEAARIYAAEWAAAPVAQRGRIAPAHQLDELFALWLTDFEKTHHKDTVKTYLGYSRGFVEFFGTSLLDVTRARMGDYQRDRLTKVTRGSLKKEKSALNGFLEWCLEQGVLNEDHVPKWPHLPKRALGTRSGKQRTKAVDVTPEQVRAFVLALPILSLRARKGHRFPVRARFVFMAETGLRPATLNALEVPKHWRPGATELEITSDIDKARYGRTLPLTPRAIAALEAAVTLTGLEKGLIFGKHDYRTPFEAARVLVGLPEEFAPYDLRHHFAGFMADGAEARAAMHLIGHKRLTTTDRYVRGQEDRARVALSALGSRGILGEGDLPMLSAKEGSRTLTGVTPLEPESGEKLQVPDNYEGEKGHEGSETTSDTPSSWGSPETPGRSAVYLAALRASWDDLENFVASELLGRATEPPPDEPSSDDDDVLEPLRRVTSGGAT